MMRAALVFTGRGMHRAARLLERAARAHDYTVQSSMATHDMDAHPDEPHFRAQYWHWLRPELERRFPQRNAVACDLGCAHGRLTIPLAQWLTEGKVRGVDFTAETIRVARCRAEAARARNADFAVSDVNQWLGDLPDASMDIVLFTEIAFFMPAYKHALAEIARVLKSGGLLFASFRSQFHVLLEMIRHREWSSVEQVRDTRAGYLRNGGFWLAWHTPADVRRELTAAGFRVDDVVAVGPFSGIEGDPMAVFARPSELADADRARLLEIELSLAHEYAACGRYILAIATRETEAGSGS